MPVPQTSAFVGRERELKAVRSVVEGALSGTAGAILITGDAGEGKTALIDQALATASPAVVLQGQCLPLSTFAIPLSPIRSALRQAPQLGYAPPDLLDGDGAVAQAPTQLDSWLDTVCDETPVMLAVDDLHWADRPTLDVLMYLIAGRRDRRLAVLLTLRQTEVGAGHPVNPWLADVSRLPGFERVRLGPLSQTETYDQLTGLLGGRPHHTLAGAVFERSQGNPYFNRLLVSEVDLSARQLTADMPDNLHEALVGNWHRLGPAARQLTALISLAGLPLGTVDLAKVIAPQLPMLAIEAALAEAVDGHVLEVGDDGTYWFHHPLQAEVLRAQLPHDERLRWHEVFAAYLEGASGRRGTEALIRLADHHFAAGHAEDAFDAALRAGAAAEASTAYADAIRLVRHAVQLLPAVTQTAVPRLDLLLRVRKLAERSGDIAAERAAIDDLLAALDPERQPLDTAELIVRRVHLRQMLVEDFAPIDEVSEAVRLGTADPDSWQYGYALAEQARVAVWTADPAASGLAERALAVAEQAGQPRALCYAHTARAMVEVGAGRLSEAVASAQRGREAAAEAKDFWGYVHATLWATNAVEVWSSAECAALLRAARTEAIRLGAPARYVNILAVAEAGAALAVGNWTSCAGLLRATLGSALAPLHDAQSRLTAARLASLQGRSAEALAHLERAEEICSDLGGFAPLDACAVMAEVLVQAGHPEEAARTALGALHSSALPPTMCEWLVPLAARALADQQQRARERGESSAAVEQELGALQEEYPPPPYGTAVKPSIPASDNLMTPLYRRQLDGLGQWYAAECGRARGKPGNGAQWVQAARMLTQAKLPWEAAYAAFRSAEANLGGRQPDRHAAAGALREAAEASRRLGARPVLDRVERLARTARINLTSPASRPLGMAGLTPRENDVLRYLVAGRTYHEIADALVLSEKTVSSHISNMLRKTGASNRIELARRAADPAHFGEIHAPR